MNMTYRQLIARMIECIPNLDADARVRVISRNFDNTVIHKVCPPIRFVGMALAVEHRDIESAIDETHLDIDSASREAYNL